MAVLAPRILLNNVDLPTFGRPMMATSGIGAAELNGRVLVFVGESRIFFIGLRPYHMNFGKHNRPQVHFMNYEAI